MSESSDIVYFIACLVVTFLSVICSWIILSLLKKKTSTYARIMWHISLSESIFIFSQMLVVTTNYNLIQKFKYIVSLLFHSLQFRFQENYVTTSGVLIAANRSLYFAMEAYCICFNLFLCLEMILILKNPIAQMKSRIKTYLLLSNFCAVGIFLLVFIGNPDPTTVEAEVFFKQMWIPLLINFILFILFLFVGLISIFYLVNRFCLGKSLLQNMKNVFVIRHSFYVFIYILCFSCLKINAFCSFAGLPLRMLEVSFILSLSTGLFMFILRASETRILWKFLFCCPREKTNNQNTSFDDSKRISIRKDEGDVFFEKDQPLTAIISRNMNLEFMCCILYGLTEIFMKPERKKNVNTYNNDNTITQAAGMSSQPSDKTALVSGATTARDFIQKDIQRSKTHRIRYKKIFNEDIDFDQLEVEVVSNKKKGLKWSTRESSMCDSESLISNNTSLEDHDAIVIEYCPKLFRELRKMDDIDGSSLDRSLNPSNNQENINKIRESEGKSGSFFFFSHDNKFIIKTVTSNELKTMIGPFMKAYYDHTTSTPETLLAKIYGLFSIVIKGVSKINVILMQNILTIPKIHVKRVFDLKGSRVERITKNIEKCDKLKALKDLDYLWMIKIEQDLIDFTRDAVEELSSSLLKDITMLRELGVMDYSLLLVIVNFPRQTDTDYASIINLFGDTRYCRRIFKSKNMKYIYILGIIDYLQKFNVAKFFENKYKSLVYGDEIKYVSAVDPMIYSDRMFNFARESIFFTTSS